MSDIKRSMDQNIETLLGIFTVDKGKIKILLLRKKTEPYKGYWVLPGNKINGEDSLEDVVTSTVYDKLGLPNLYLEQCHTFCDHNQESLEQLFSITYMGLIDNITLFLKKEDRANLELEWFDIHEIPKTGYNHDKMIEILIHYFTQKIKSSNILRMLFPSDFTLPELQKVYEQILNISIDRRNFRKKLITLDYIEDTGDINEGYTGRPAKLYRFKEDLEEKNIF